MLSKGKFLLGKTFEGEPVEVSLSDLSTHMHILGATGSGKTLLLNLIDFQAYLNELALIKADMKFDEGNFKLNYALSYYTGRNFYFFNPYAGQSTGLLASLGSHSYNPLLIGNAETITSKIINAAERPGGSVSFYEEVKENLVLALVSGLLSTGLKFSFKDLWVCLLRGKNGDYPALKRLIEISKDTASKVSLTELYQRLTSENNTLRTQAEKEITGTRLFFQRFSVGAVAELVNSYNPDIDLLSTISAGDTVMFVLPVLLYEVVSKAIGKMLLADLRYITGYMASVGIKKDFVISIDEFENFVFKGIEDIFNKGRSAGAKVIIAHQSIKDIDLAYSQELRGIIQANTRIKVFLAQADVESAEWFSKLVGEKDLAYSMPLESISLREVSNYMVPPKELTSLKTFSAYYYIKGKPLKGHILTVPTDFVLGKDIPKPEFKPKVDRTNGIRLYEYYLEAGGREEIDSVYP
ncbi:MAG: TraM recognition domain-containing protein [Desulfurococcaceae archaeon]